MSINYAFHFVISLQDPTAPEPFQTLANLYEEIGDQDRSLQFALIAAHLAPQVHIAEYFIWKKGTKTAEHANHPVW